MDRMPNNSEQSLAGAGDASLGCLTCVLTLLEPEDQAFPAPVPDNIKRKLGNPPNSRWPQNSTISISFFTKGPDRAWSASNRELFFKYVEGWRIKKPGVGANLTFQPRPDNDNTADVRVYLRNQPDSTKRIYFSLLGKGSRPPNHLKANADEPQNYSMVLDVDHADGSKPNNEDANYPAFFKAIILHEFGHALGFVHEHFHPEFQKKFPGGFTVQTLKAYFPTSTEEQIKSLKGEIMNRTEDMKKWKTPGIVWFNKDRADRKSIMMYSFKALEKDPVTGQQKVVQDRNWELSELDLQLAAQVYK